MAKLPTTPSVQRLFRCHRCVAILLGNHKPVNSRLLAIHILLLLHSNLFYYLLASQRAGQCSRATQALFRCCTAEWPWISLARFPICR